MTRDPRAAEDSEPAAGAPAGAPRGLRRLVLADPLSPEGVELLRNAPGIQLDDLSGLPRAQLLERLSGAAGLIVRSGTEVDDELLAAAGSLQAVGRAGVGLDNIDVEAATRRGIAVLNAPGGNTFSTAELAFGLLLAAARRIPEADRSVREGRWERKGLRGTQLHGKCLGVIGAGRIGSEVIRRGRAFGMRVLVCDPYLTEERAADLAAEHVELDELLERSEFVSVHAPLTEHTRGLIGRAEIGRMPAGAVLVNAARGGIVDEAALAEALTSGHLGGAALDVFEVEPLPPDHPLRRAPGLVLTPHLGAATPDAQREVAIEIAAAVRDALLDGDLRAAVNAPPIDPALRESFAPVADLAGRLGTLLAELVPGACGRIEVGYAGPHDDGLRMLAAAALEGFLRGSVDRPLNIVNSLHLAAERGIKVSRERLGARATYPTYIELRATADNGRTHVVGGALLGEGHARLVRVDGFHVDTVPAGSMLLIRNRDVPGVIGEVGSRLGAAGINIGEYHQSRRETGGEALAVVTVDEPLPAEMIAELRALPNVHQVRQVSFGPAPAERPAV